MVEQIGASYVPQMFLEQNTQQPHSINLQIQISDTVATTSCSQTTARHANAVRRRIFLYSNKMAPRRIITRHHSFPGAKEMRETRHHLRACVRVRGAHFRAQILTILSRSVTATNGLPLLNKPYFSLLCGVC